MAATEDSTTSSPPPTPTSPTPSLASSTIDPETPKTQGKQVFKSNLQVLLKRQESELMKNIEYKKKKEEEGNEDNDGSSKGEKFKGEDEDGENDIDNDEVFEAPAKGKDKGKESKKVIKGDEEVGENEKAIDQKKGGKEETNEKDCKDKSKSMKKAEETGEGKDKVESNDKGKYKDKSPEKTKPHDSKAGNEKDKKEEKKTNDNEGKEIDDKAKKKEEEEKNIAKEKEEKKEKEKKEKEKREKEKEKEKKEKENTVKEKEKNNKNKEKSKSKEGSPPKKKKKNDGSDSPTSGGKDVSADGSKTGKADNEKQKTENVLEDIEPGTCSLLSPPVDPLRTMKKEGEEKEEGDGKPTKKAVKKEKHMGTMMKKGTSPFSLWKKYYFVLDGKLLMYYRSGNDYTGLAGARGSLDLTLLEDVRIKKPGRMKSIFPFCLTRRNLKKINLATDTEDERERWMGILRGTLDHPNRLSGSENVLSTTDSPSAEAKQEKYATMPVRPATSRSEESSSESEKEEDQLFIKPKKVQRVGPGIALDLGAVKLRKVEEVKKEIEEKAPDTEKKEEGAEAFGVKLRKSSAKGAAVQSCVNGKEVSETPDEGCDSETTLKRPNKQPNIPLNKSPLLSKAEIDTSRISPDSKRSNTVERNKSPSPSIPLSKGVHAFLNKSNDEHERSNSETPCELTKINDVPVYIAESREIRYSDDLLSIEDAPPIEYVQVEERLLCTEDDTTYNIGRNDAETTSTRETKETIGIPQVSITLKENSEEETEYEEFDEDFLQTMQQNKTAELTNRESGKFSADRTSVEPKQADSEVNDISESSDASQSSDEEECKDSAITDKDKILPIECSEIDQSKESKETNNDTQGSPLSVEEQHDDDIDEEFLKNVTTARRPSGTSIKGSSLEVLTLPSGRLSGPEGGMSPPRSPFRMRTGTNESSNSSSKSDSENSDKKLGKFKFFHSKRSGSSDEIKKEDDGKDDKERKRKKSSFSKFLPGKKSKDKKSKDEVDDLKYPQSENCPIVPETNASNKDNQALVREDICSETVGSSDPDEKPEHEVNIPKVVYEDTTEDQENCTQVELRYNQSITNEESRCSTYSRSSNTSREADPPPMVPEKRGIRAMSPSYDVPQCNQPVNSSGETMDEMHEPEEDRTVDGMISQEQINAILSARDTRERRRKSSCRSSSGFLAPPDSIGNDASEDALLRRPSKISVTSTESDEPLPKTNFLCDYRNSSSSGSLKNQAKSDDSDTSTDALIPPHKNHENLPEPDPAVVMRRSSRLTDNLISGPRVSLTLPEFTVMEEEGPVTPDQEKAVTETGSQKTSETEEGEENDYFPVIGGGIELRNNSPSKLIPESNAGIRTSGIVGLKAFLEENQEEIPNTRSGISRLGHSAAVEKLKRESSEES